MSAKLLVVDGDAGARRAICDFLQRHDFELDEASDCESARLAFVMGRPDAVIIDYVLPDGNAIDLLRKLRSTDPLIPIMILTAESPLHVAVRAMKEGADEIFTKPLELPTLLAAAKRLVAGRRVQKKANNGEARPARVPVDPFLGSSTAIKRLSAQVRRVVSHDSTVLLQGETGTGKGVLARWIHRNSRRSMQPLVHFNCADLTRQDLETDLRGREGGAAFTRPGLLLLVNRGTLFLDEIADADLEIQPKLLSVLEANESRRSGSLRANTVDVRVIAATHRDLAAEARDGKFRTDLYYRVSAVPIAVPPLRERPEDIPILARHLLQSIIDALDREDICLSSEAERALTEYSWPGNIRELRNVLERAALLTDGSRLESVSLSFNGTKASPTLAGDSGLTLEALERLHIQRVLERQGGRVELAAQALGVPRSSLYQKIKRYGVAVSRV